MCNKPSIGSLNTVCNHTGAHSLNVTSRGDVFLVTLRHNITENGAARYTLTIPKRRLGSTASPVTVLGLGSTLKVAPWGTRFQTRRCVRAETLPWGCIGETRKACCGMLATTQKEVFLYLLWCFAHTRTGAAARRVLTKLRASGLNNATILGNSNFGGGLSKALSLEGSRVSVRVRLLDAWERRFAFPSPPVCAYMPIRCLVVPTT